MSSRSRWLALALKFAKFSIFHSSKISIPFCRSTSVKVLSKYCFWYSYVVPFLCFCEYQGWITQDNLQNTVVTLNSLSTRTVSALLFNTVKDKKNLIKRVGSYEVKIFLSFRSIRRDLKGSYHPVMHCWSLTC